LCDDGDWRRDCLRGEMKAVDLFLSKTLSEKQVQHSFSILFLWSILLIPVLGFLSGQVYVGQATAQTQLLKLNMIVADDSNQPISNLRPEDIQVLDGGVSRKITLVTEDNRPIAYAVTVDCSGSFRFLLEPTLRAVRSLIEGNRPKDEMTLIRYVSSDKIEKVQEFSADKSELVNSLKRFRPQGGQSAVIDGVYFSVQEIARYKAGDPGVHRAVVLISDGEDRASMHSEEDLIKLLRENDVQVFVVGIVTQLDKEGGLIRPSPRQKAEQLLKRIAEESGGRLVFPNNERELLGASSEIIRDLHSQYSVVFERPEPVEKGFHKVRVKINETAGRKHPRIITRSGYSINVYNTVPKTVDKTSP
jgi:VWFA-related protein